MANATSIATQAAVSERRRLRSIQNKTARAVAKKTEALKVLKIEYLKPESISANPYNPNRQTEHDFELLCTSIEEDGFTQPVVAVRMTDEHVADPKLSMFNVGDVVIVDGEHRWRAAQTIGIAEIPVVITPFTPTQMRVATLRHNRARGSEDMGLAADVLRDLQQLGAIEHAKDSLMLSDEEINRLLEEASAADKLAGASTGEATDVGQSTASTTAAAVEAQRTMEAKLQQAKSDEEKAMIRKDSDVLRLQFILTGVEAAAVRAVLGAKPAQNLVAICRFLEGKTDAVPNYLS